MSVKTITRIALMSAILYVSKFALDAVPNVELVSFLLIVYTIVFGAETFAVTVVFNTFQLIQWGFGDWWFMYLYIWPFLVLVTLLLRKKVKEEFLVWAVVSGIFGLAFGLLCTPVYLIEVGPQTSLARWISGLVFDIPHCISNFLIMLLLGKPMCMLLKKLKASYEK